MRSTLLLLLAACNDYEIKGSDELINGNETEGAPDIAVDPTLIAFGQVGVGTGIATIETVTITNEGDEALEIHGLSLENPELLAVYTISAIGAVLVPPGSSTTFTVTYEPLTATEYNTRILVDSNDPDEPQVPVDLTATGLAPVIELSPVAYDFGTSYIGCDIVQPITITNSGNADLIVDDFDYISASNDLYFDGNETVNGALPWTILPGTSMEVLIEYAPLDDYADEGYLSVHSNDPFQTTAQAFQTGGGELYGQNLDVFEQPIRGASDILFIIDNSCSMANEQTSLADNFEYFAAGLVELEVDYQLAVITTDNPAFRGEIITADTSDMEAEFIAQTAVGTGGSGDEKPTEMAYQATESGGDAGPGSDFLRDDSMLALIFVSDEPDSSPSAWADYLAHFESLKDDADDLIIHAISGDYPSGCGDASYTNTVYELTVATAGLYLSVCATDWASHLEALVDASAADLSSFELSEWPVPETIIVRVDGIATTVGWSYIEGDRSVNFDEAHVPEGGSTIEVEYALFGDCEG
ncbi:MAG: choice-of-anchor D domain-containing protein [Pseudomonadota bacterium]|nr:choice-of-anchor D domain-containing protein [Pseudomonadota bacterium]